MAKVYLSPSNHGVGQNKCLWQGCYEDKHTRPIAEACAKYLEKSGINTKIAAASTTIMNGARNKEANAFGADLYVPIHTNASSSSSAHYLLFMFWADNSAYRKIFNAVAPYIEAIYPENLKAKFSVRKDLYEIKHPNAKTLYCELGFHTNPTDCDNFIHHYDAIGKALAHGICDYFGIKFSEGEDNKPKPTPTPAPTPAPAPTPKKVLIEDGEWGVNTTKYTQRLMGTVQDGIVSAQRKNAKKYLPAAHTGSWQFNKIVGGGSPMIKKLQAYIGLSGKDCDGLFGPGSVKQLQTFLKKRGLYTGAIDGIMGAGTARGWQKYLNQQF